jgi:hypothetical protein
MKALLISLINALTFRIRGGLRIPHTDKKFPLNKWWFALSFALSACYLRGWDTNFFIIMLIATRLSTQLYGWGEYVGCVLGLSKPDPERKDCDLVDDIVDSLRITINIRDIKIWKFTLHIPQINWKLSDYPKAWGWLGLSLRGLVMSFIIGLALNSIPYMVCGFAMGTVYWLASKFNKVVDDGKSGWKWAEIFWGMVLGIFLTLFA